MSALILHEKFADRKNNIGLIKVANQFSFNDAVRPIKLMTEEMPIGTEVIVAGWMKSELKGYIRKLLSSDLCDNNYPGVLCLGRAGSDWTCNVIFFCLMWKFN